MDEDQTSGYTLTHLRLAEFFSCLNKNPKATCTCFTLWLPSLKLSGITNINF